MLFVVTKTTTAAPPSKIAGPGKKVPGTGATTTVKGTVKTGPEPKKPTAVATKGKQKLQKVLKEKPPIRQVRSLEALQQLL